MGTSNFYNKNASKIYACEIQEEWDYDDLKGNLASELKAKFNNDYIRPQEREFDNERNFSGEYIGLIFDEIAFTDSPTGEEWYLHIKIKPIIRSGYYDGCNLDYEIESTIWTYGYEDNFSSENFSCDDESIFKEFLHEIKEKFKYHKRLIKQIESFKTESIKKLEQVYNDYSNPLKTFAKFSNGETIYIEANSEKAKLAELLTLN